MPIDGNRTDMNPKKDKMNDREYDRPTKDTVAAQERSAKGASREGNTRWASGKAGGESDRWKSGRVIGEIADMKSGKP